MYYIDKEIKCPITGASLNFHIIDRLNICFSEKVFNIRILSYVDVLCYENGLQNVSSFSFTFNNLPSTDDNPYFYSLNSIVNTIPDEYEEDIRNQKYLFSRGVVREYVLSKLSNEQVNSDETVEEDYYEK